jgi:hypothetical protein
MRPLENKGLRASFVVLGLFLLAMSCTSSGGRVTTLLTPTDWEVFVGPNPCDLTDAANQSTPTQVVVVGKHKIHWMSKSKQPFYLVLHVPRACSLPFPFSSAIVKRLPYPDANGRVLYLVRGDKDHQDHIMSDKVKDDACACDTSSSTQAQCENVDPNNPKAWQIKYDQYVFDPGSGEYLPCDGWIIIDK